MYSTLTIKSIIISYKISYKGSLYFSIPGVYREARSQLLVPRSAVPNPDNLYTILHIYRLNSISNPMLYAEGKYPERLRISKRPLKIGRGRVTRKEASICMLLDVESL
jgi:hypothetical protein